MSKRLSLHMPVFFCDANNAADRELAYQQKAKEHLKLITKNYLSGWFSTHGPLCKAINQKLKDPETDPLQLLYGVYFYLHMFTNSKSLKSATQAAIENIFATLSYDTARFDSMQGTMDRLCKYKERGGTSSEAGEQLTIFAVASEIRWCAEIEKRLLKPVERSRTADCRNLLFTKPIKPIHTVSLSYLHNSNKPHNIARIFEFFVMMFRKHKRLAKALEALSIKNNPAHLKPELLLHALHVYLLRYTDSKRLLQGVEDILIAKYGDLNSFNKLSDLAKTLGYGHDTKRLVTDLQPHLEWCADIDNRPLTLNHHRTGYNDIVDKIVQTPMKSSGTVTISHAAYGRPVLV